MSDDYEQFFTNTVLPELAPAVTFPAWLNDWIEAELERGEVARQRFAELVLRKQDNGSIEFAIVRDADV